MVAIFSLCTAQAVTIIVDVNGSGDYTKIQDAITNSTNGDEIIVLQGTYYENIDFEGRAVTLRSSEPNDPNVIVNTIIDANQNGSAITCDSSEEPNTIIKGFIITDGNASCGGGIYCLLSNPTLISCTFVNNTAITDGGGICFHGSTSKLINCIFNNNVAGDEGGGMYCGGRPSLTNCTFISNNAAFGRGMFCDKWDSNAILSNCNFINNSAQLGGGMYSYLSEPILDNCAFIANKATFSHGGGMCFSQSWQSALTNCTFINNDANDSGGGIGAGIESEVLLTNCKFINNSSGINGGGLANLGSSSSILTNCKLVENSTANNGGGIFSDGYSYSTLVGTIVCGNNPDQIYGEFSRNGENTISRYPPPIPPLAGYIGDLDGDGKVDFADLAMFAENWLIGVN
ncbi:MAG: right-handed parallel beta-helix repeat-containing protein [Planctomycetota bacterium]